MKKIVLTALFLQAVSFSVIAQLRTNAPVLAKTSIEHREKEVKNFQLALKLAKDKGWDLSYKTSNGNIAFLVGVDRFGYPLYYTTENNIVAAATTRANVLWPGGSSGLNLDGSPLNMKDKMAVWDGGRVLSTHVELNGRVNQKDAPSSISDHSTHVAGTMIATGINPNAKGMSFANQQLIAFDFNSDVSEMFGEAQNLLLSNHSYGTIAGWYFNESASRWEFRGRADENEDYKFGYYDDKAQLLDSIAYNAPFYLIVKSSGNNRNENGPNVGQNYWRFNAAGGLINAGARPPGISNNDSYDIISTYGVAKNVLTVGAISGLAYGYNKSEDAIISTFSSYGPTDDGRIKPDVVADGVDVLSPVASNNNAYASFSGTSMATPNTTGSLLLLQQYYSQLHSGSFMRSATLKALTIHTADEAGDAPGPDYRFGWGVVNVGKSAEVIKTNNSGNHQIIENVLNAGGVFTMNVIASGQGQLVATIAWTDPKGNVETVNVLNNPARKLVNDLDIRITRGTTTYMPWILDPAVPVVAAGKGDNVLDNVEKINVENVIPGESYTITISHKGTLSRGSQAYSLILSGVGGQAICSSSANSNTGARIDNFQFGTINKNNPAGCTTYNNYTDLSATVEPGQTLPVSVAVSSCDATSNPKIVKIFIDYNNNGVFTDAGELVATSNAISGSGTFNTNITIPLTVVSGNASRMRVVAQETSNAADVNPCGSYGNGETQDYKINFAPASNDIALLDLVGPTAENCSNNAQYVTIRMRNTGNINKLNFPVSVIIKNGATTVATLTATYPSTVVPSGVASYTFQTPFATTPGTTYNMEVIVSDGTDQNRSNDTIRKTITIAAAVPTPAGTGVVCGTTALLRVTNPNPSANYFWYTSPTSESSITTGPTASTSVIPSNNTYYVGIGAKGSVGPVNNTAWGNAGGYVSGSANFIKYSSSVPVILETAKLYTRMPGKIDFIVADILSQTSTSYSYSAISTTTLEVYSTSPNPVPGAQGFDPNDNGAQFALNLYLPAGEHAIIIRPQGDANIFRNNNVTGSPYPFSLGNLISFTNNSATSSSDPNYYQNFYYSLYDMKVRTADCLSERASVVVPVAPTPAITMVGDSLMSSVDNGNQWYLNGIGIVGGTTKKIKPVQSGNYMVTVTDGFGCQRTSSAFPFIASAINPVDNAAIELTISPNPNKGSFRLKFKADKREDMKIEIMNAQGQIVHMQAHPKFAGTFSEQLNLQAMASGVYVLRLQHGNKIYYNKILIER